jgi:hypothetical protein
MPSSYVDVNPAADPQAGPFHLALAKKAKLTSPTAVIDGVLKNIVTVASINKRYAILHARGSASVYVSRDDFLPIQDNDLKRRLAAEVVVAGTKNDQPIYKSAFSYWTGHADRHVYRTVEFTSREVAPDVYNLFHGLGVTPRRGHCGKILTHIREVICSGDPVANEAMLSLLAWQIQNIGKPSRTVVVLKSEKHQVGKGQLLAELMAPIYGPSGFAPSTMDQVLGRFNDCIRGRAFIFLDEVLFGGDKRSANGIKSLSTSTSVGIETKGLPIVTCPVAVNFWLATNHENAAHIEESDERYWVLNVSEHRRGDHAYFTALSNEIKDGGREAFADLLLHRDISKFVPWRDCPKNNSAKRDMIRHSVNPYDARKWIEDCCNTECLIGRRTTEGAWHPWVEGTEHPFAVLSAAYVEWQKGVKSPVAPGPTPTGGLGEILNSAGFVGRRATHGERVRVLPSTTECLAKLWE